MIYLSVYALIIGLLYASVQLYLLHHWKKLKEWIIPNDFVAETSVVIIIPARNEEKSIQSCLRSIANQYYPAELFEIIVVDDHSEDKTVQRIAELEEPSISVIELNNLDLPETKAHKKRALELGIQQSTAKLIITTDADIQVDEYWLATIVSYFQKHKPAMVTGPVLFDPVNSLFERFQALDFIGMMGITGGGISSGLFHMSNGANLAFTREAFNKINGYEGVDTIASGDDILLTQKIKKQKDLLIHFLKSKTAIVKTKPVIDLSAFYNQRLRWGSKSEHYSEKSIIWVQFLVLVTCLSILTFVLMMFFNFLKYLIPLGILWVFKILADYVCLRHYSKFFEKSKLMRSFKTAQVLHVFYISIIGLLSVFVRKYRWKGRMVK